MRCPDCGKKDLPFESKFCLECGSKLPHASAAQVPSSGTKDGREVFAQVATTAQQADAGGKSDLGVDKGRFEGIFVWLIWLKISIPEGNKKILGGDRKVDFLRTIKAAIGLFSILNLIVCIFQIASEVLRLYQEHL